MAILKEIWSKEIPNCEVTTTFLYVIDLQERLNKSVRCQEINLKELRDGSVSIITGQLGAKTWS